VATCRPGRVRFGGRRVVESPEQRCSGDARHHAVAPEADGSSPTLSVEENLVIGATALTRARAERNANASSSRVLSAVHALPDLREADPRGGALSGGQQQMLAIGARVDVESDGLAAHGRRSVSRHWWSRKVYSFLEALREDGLTLVLVERRVGARALEFADRAMVMQERACCCSTELPRSQSRCPTRGAFLGEQAEATP